MGQAQVLAARVEKKAPAPFVEISAKPEPEGIRTLGGIGKKFSERDERIRKDYAEGATQREIGDRERLCPSTVCRICKGVERKARPIRKRDPEKEERDERIRKAYAQWETQTEIACREGLCPSTVCRICKGVERESRPVRKRDPEKEERDERIRKDYAEGATQREIIERERIGRHFVCRICRGVERKAGRIILKGLKKEERDERIRKAYANGEMQKEIAKGEGLCPSTVCRICRGVERKD